MNESYLTKKISDYFTFLTFKNTLINHMHED